MKTWPPEHTGTGGPGGGRFPASLALIVLLAACAAEPPAPERRGAPPPPEAAATVSGLRALGGARLEQVTGTSRAEFAPSLDARGTHLLVSVDLGDDAGGSAIDIVAVHTGARRRVLDGGGALARWSPDGRFFVYRSALTRTLAYRGVDDGQSFPLLPQPLGASDTWFDLSVDGKRVAVESHTGMRTRIHVVELQDNATRVVGDGLAPGWHPDGRRLVFHRRAGTHYQLFLADTVSGAVRQVTGGPRHSWSGVISPDGRHVSYLGGETGAPQLFMARLDGSGEIQLTAGEAGLRHPDWGVDGAIYFASRAGRAPGSRLTGIWRLYPPAEGRG